MQKIVCAEQYCACSFSALQIQYYECSQSFSLTGVNQCVYVSAGGGALMSLSRCCLCWLARNIPFTTFFVKSCFGWAYLAHGSRSNQVSQAGYSSEKRESSRDGEFSLTKKKKKKILKMCLKDICLLKDYVGFWKDGLCPYVLSR